MKKTLKICSWKKRFYPQKTDFHSWMNFIEIYWFEIMSSVELSNEHSCTRKANDPMSKAKNMCFWQKIKKQATNSRSQWLHESFMMRQREDRMDYGTAVAFIHEVQVVKLHVSWVYLKRWAIENKHFKPKRSFSQIQSIYR